MIKNFLLEEKGKGFSGDLVVLGVGGESRMLVPKKLEESRGPVVEAMGMAWFHCYALSVFLLSIYFSGCSWSRKVGFG